MSVRSGQRRAALVTGLALAACTAITACTGPATTSSEGEPPVDASFVVKDPETFSLPLDAYQAIGEQADARGNARVRLLTECMKRFGFTFEVPPAEPNKRGMNAERYGVADEKKVAALGYRANPGKLEEEKPKGPVLTPEAEAVLNGDGASTVAGKAVPKGGCKAESEAKLEEGAPRVGDPDLGQKLRRENYERTLRDSRVVKAAADWSACMKQAGYTYADPMAANNDPALTASDKPTDKEIAVAIADVTCKKKTNYVNIVAAVETAYQLRAIEKNKAALDVMKANLDAQLRRAAQVNAGR